MGDEMKVGATKNIGGRKISMERPTNYVEEFKSNFKNILKRTPIWNLNRTSEQSFVPSGYNTGKPEHCATGIQ